MRRVLQRGRPWSAAGAVPTAFLAVFLGCGNTLERDVEKLIANLESEAAAAAQDREDWHRGPAVAPGDSGPARFVEPLLRAFQRERCQETLRFLDRFYRAPANDGYDASIDHLEERLRQAGFGADERFELRVLENDRAAPAWTPIEASLALRLPGGEDEVLHAFSDADDRDRCMLPVNTPSCDVEGRLALDLDHIEEGSVLLTAAPARQVYRRARSRGAAALLSASLETFNVDPTGGDRHLDAIQFRRLPEGSDMPVAQISQRVFDRLVAAHRDDPTARVAFRAEVRFDQRPLRTLVAAIVGKERPDEAVAIVSHVQEPGACDNASGVAGLMEGALTLSGLLRKGDVEWPERTLVFIWGDEFRQTRAWLDFTERSPVAGISSDMTGQSRERTGAIALLERSPDPGAVVPLPPDEHTPWGAGEVQAERLNPSGLNVIARCALVDVGRAEGGWECADHPWEGGSDHDVFNDRDIPAVLFWHFTDFTYHTSLDRLDMVDVAEIRRTNAAIMSTALAVADPRPDDLARYLDSLDIERQVRTRAAREAEEEGAIAMWETWCREARFHLRELCLGMPPESGDPTKQ